jgi:predicted alpha/beta-fold hydrolase
LVRRRTDLAGYEAARLAFALDDGSGDALVGTLNWPVAGGRARPLAVLIHGLTGCESSSYMLHSAAHLLSLGYRVLRLNLRGAGPNRDLCRHCYHAGRTGDLATVLARLDPDLTRDGIVLVGYSLGANMLLKFLAEHGRAFPVRVAASVSAPIDLAAASRRMMARRNRPYQAWLLARMKHDCTGPRAVLSPAERRALALARTVWEFDDGVVAPRNGYADAAAYYADNSAQRFLPSIPVPTLLIHAADDPWIPPEAYRNHDWAANPRLVPAFAHGGGHVGFHGAGHDIAWHDRTIAGFFDTQ